MAVQVVTKADDYMEVGGRATQEAKADDYMEVGGRATQEAKADDYMEVGGRATQEAKADDYRGKGCSFNPIAFPPTWRSSSRYAPMDGSGRAEFGTEAESDAGCQKC